MTEATASFGLYLVLTDPLVGYEACTQAAVAAGVRYVQLRMKRARPEAVLEMALRLREITRGSATRFIVNDDVEVAAAVDADGVHLGQGDLPLQEARRRWPVPGKLFGLSTHDEEQVARARALHPDYIGVGPLYPTPTKATPDPVLGLERASRIVREAGLVCVGIGGIDASTLPAVLDAGLTNFAVVRHVCASPHPDRALRELQDLVRARPPCGVTST